MQSFFFFSSFPGIQCPYRLDIVGENLCITLVNLGVVVHAGNEDCNLDNLAQVTTTSLEDTIEITESLDLIFWRGY